MLVKAEILQYLKANIHQIPISEFVSEGGWPNLEDLDVLIYHQESTANGVLVRMDILYLSTKPGCCFIPAKEQYLHLPKQMEVTPSKVILTDY